MMVAGLFGLMLGLVTGMKERGTDNKDNNSNHTENNQKVTAKDECNNNEKIKDHNKDNNILVCSTDAVNLKDSVLPNSKVFGDTVQTQFP